MLLKALQRSLGRIVSVKRAVYNCICADCLPAGLWCLPSFLLKMSPEVKRPEREANHSHPLSFQVKTEWNCTSVPPVYLYCVIRGNFSFVFTVTFTFTFNPTFTLTHTFNPTFIITYIFNPTFTFTFNFNLAFTFRFTFSPLLHLRLPLTPHLPLHLPLTSPLPLHLPFPHFYIYGYL